MLQLQWGLLAGGHWNLSGVRTKRPDLVFWAALSLLLRDNDPRFPDEDVGDMGGSNSFAGF